MGRWLIILALVVALVQGKAKLGVWWEFDEDRVFHFEDWIGIFL